MSENSQQIHSFCIFLEARVWDRVHFGKVSWRPNGGLRESTCDEHLQDVRDGAGQRVREDAGQHEPLRPVEGAAQEARAAQEEGDAHHAQQDKRESFCE